MLQRQREQGFGLVTVLIVIPLLLVMVLALFAALNNGNRWTGTHYGETAAAYVAEAGAVDALQALKADPGWAVGFADKPMLNGHGTYTVRFNQTGGTFDPADSVNNFDGTHSDSFLGPDSVPVGAALVVVTAKVGSRSRREAYLIGTGDSTIRVEQGLLTSGKIRMEGETKVRAVESLSEAGDLPALVQSNLGGSDNDLISWVSGMGGNLLIEGQVLSAGNTSAAIDLSGYVPTEGVATNAPEVAIPPAGIESAVASRRTSTPFPPGNTNVPSGENYYDATTAPLVITGDLVLNGDLYVEGDLQVNGSISGIGSVYVTGETELFGDSRIDADDKVALYSQGHVTLSGFDGDLYLDGIAAGNSDFAGWLADSRWATQQLRTQMLDGSWAGADWSTVDTLTSVLAPFLSPGDRASQVPGRNGATLIRMREVVEGLPAGPSRNFMVDKLDTMGRMFSQNGNVLGRTDATARTEFFDHGNTDGLIDASNDLNETAYKLAAFNIVKQVNYDRLGSSYFQGLVYTNGAFYASNQVTVLGAVVVNGDATQDPLVTPDGDTLEPGDLVLKGGSNITYVKDFFFGPDAGPTPGPRRILLHLGDG